MFLLIAQEAHTFVACHASHPEILDQEIVGILDVGDGEIDMV